MLKKYGAFQEEHIARYTHQMLKGLHYLHSKHIIHSDLKVIRHLLRALIF